jgi:hypothetical protein
MSTDPKSINIPDWQNIVKMGLGSLIQYWMDGEPKSKEFRATVVLFAFLKSLDNQAKKQTKLLEGLVNE